MSNYEHLLIISNYALVYQLWNWCFEKFGSLSIIINIIFRINISASYLVLCRFVSTTEVFFVIKNYDQSIYLKRWENNVIKEYSEIHQNAENTKIKRYHHHMMLYMKLEKMNLNFYITGRPTVAPKKFWLPVSLVFQKCSYWFQ